MRDGRGGAIGGEGDGAEGSPALPDREGTPWVETREGLLFFANAVLVAPELFVLVPLGLRVLLDPLFLHGRPSVMLDTIPAVAAHVLPWVGWLVAGPLALTLYDLRIEARPWPRRALLGFLVVHGGFLAYTVFRWVGG